MSEPILQIRNLTTTFPSAGKRVPVVDGINLSINAGEILSLVGESGSGKSMTALSAMRLVPKPGRIEPHSSIILEGRDILKISVGEMRSVRGAGMAMIFQEPMTSLNPVLTVGDQVVEAVLAHRRGVTRKQAWNLAADALASVGIPSPRLRLKAYPHELSGGMKQRVMIAMALVAEPSLLVADEPTTALDVTIQAQILDLLQGLRSDPGMAIMLISHDLGVVAENADEVAVMYAGRLAERAPTARLFQNPVHPYTRGLLASIPPVDTRVDRLDAIPGMVPRAHEFPEGCRFKNRCRWAEPVCDKPPPLVLVEEGHAVACHVMTGNR